MEIKKKYNVGDTVWIHGVATTNKLTKGQVIYSLIIQNYQQEHYIIEIPTHIEPLLEIRTWDTISQDEHGPVGSLRNLQLSDISCENKKLSQLGYTYNSSTNEDNDDPTPEEIMAALEKSTSNLIHKPLNLKDNKNKRKYFPRKKKQ